MPGQRYESGHEFPKFIRIPSTLHHKICQFTYRNMPLDVCLSSVFTLSGIFSFITMYFHDISSLTPIFILQIFYKSANQVIDFPNNRKNKNITMNPTTPNTISANSIAPVLVTF